MTAKPVARTGDVVATASTSTNFPDDIAPTATGSWAVVGEVQYTPLELGKNGKTLVTSAIGNFLFTGTLKAGGGPASTPSSVTLSAASHVLHVNGSAPLVDGDKKKDQYGNQLEVKSSATWRTV